MEKLFFSENAEKLKTSKKKFRAEREFEQSKKAKKEEKFQLTGKKSESERKVFLRLFPSSFSRANALVRVCDCSSKSTSLSLFRRLPRKLKSSIRD